MLQNVQMVFIVRPPFPVTTRDTATVYSLRVERWMTARPKPSQTSAWSQLIILHLRLVRRALWTAKVYLLHPAKVHLLVMDQRELPPRVTLCCICAPLILKISRKRKVGLLLSNDLNLRILHRKQEWRRQLQLKHIVLTMLFRHRLMRLKLSSLNVMMMIISPTPHSLNFQMWIRSTELRKRI